MGIASFVILMLSACIELMLTIMISAMGASHVQLRDEASPVFYVIGGSMFSEVVLSLVGIVFGVGGLLQKGRRRHFAALGLLGNVGLPLVTMGALVFRMTYAGSSTGMKPVTLDAPNWNSPVAIGCMTCFLTLLPVVVWRFWRKRSSAGAAGMNCPRCHKIGLAGARFCRRCGQVFELTSL
jgi:hypothetical protein